MVSPSCTLFLLFCIQLPTQKPPLKHNLTSSKAQTPSDPFPANIIQIFKIYNSVFFERKACNILGSRRKQEKKNAIPQDWTHGSWILVHVNSEATLGSQTPPHKAQVWNLQISAQFLFLFFPSLMQKGVMENCDRPCHKAFSDILPQSRPFKFRLQQHKLGYSLPKTAILCNFPYEEGVSWSHALSWAIGLINTAHLWKNTRTKWGRTGTANYCYLVSTCINSFSDSVLFAKSI